MVEIVLCVVAVVLPFVCAAIVWYAEPENSWNIRMSRRYDKIEQDGWRYGFKWDKRGWHESPIYKRRKRRWDKEYRRVMDRQYRSLLRRAARGVRRGVLRIDVPQGISFRDWIEENGL